MGSRGQKGALYVAEGEDVKRPPSEDDDSYECVAPRNDKKKSL